MNTCIRANSGFTGHIALIPPLLRYFSQDLPVLSFSQDAPYDKRPAMDGAILLQFAFAVLATTAYSVPKKLTEKRRLSALNQNCLEGHNRLVGTVHTSLTYK